MGVVLLDAVVVNSAAICLYVSGIVSDLVRLLNYWRNKQSF